MFTLASVIYPNIDIIVLIVLVAIVFVLAFGVCPFFFGRCFRIKKVNKVDVADVSSLLENCKSLSKIEVNGGSLVLTRAQGVDKAEFEIVANAGSKLFNYNRKVTVFFHKEDTVTIEFGRDLKTIFIREKEGKSIFLSDFYSSLVIAGAAFLAVGLAIVLTVYAFAGFNVPNTRLWHENYNFAYISLIAAPATGVVSFIFNLKRMKLNQVSRKGGK